MLARLSSGTGGNAPPAGAATAIVAVVVITSYLLWGQGLSPSFAVVCVCVCLLSVVVLELTWIVVARILAPLPCKVSPALCLWCCIVSPLSHVCPLVQLSFYCAQPLYCFPLANCLRLKAYGYSTHCAEHCWPWTLWIVAVIIHLYLYRMDGWMDGWMDVRTYVCMYLGNL